MSKNLVIALRLIFRGLMTLLVIAGMAYLIYPRVVSLAAPWLQSLDSSTTTAVSPTDTPPASNELVTITSTPTPETPTTVVAQMVSPTKTATTASTDTPTPQTGETPFIVTPAPTNQAAAGQLDMLATVVSAYTPMPFKWIGSIVITQPDQAIPANMTRATFQVAEATASLLVNGTPTPIQEVIGQITPLSDRSESLRAVNQATAEYLDALATADASLNSGATPTPLSLRTVTPIRPTTTSTLTPESTSVALVIVTPTPTPENVITVAAQAARATAVATAIGTYTPMPFNWVVPIVITEPDRPIPANTATAVFLVAEATALAFVHGTPTPLPPNVWTATPTPFMQPVIGQVATPWAPPTPTATPISIPQGLVGKIIFLSNRSGGPQPLPEPLIYVIDPDGSNLAILNDDLIYKTALVRDTYSADQRYRTFVKEFPRYPALSDIPDMVPTIFIYDYHYQVEEQILYPGAGSAWDPVWSPTREQIAFVSNDSKDDEIWIINRDGADPLQLTETNEAFNAREIGKDTFIPEVNGHPSWSPDGSKIVFWSNRTRNRQIWVMNADGSNLYSLSTTSHDDWNPIWIKYTDPPREPVFGIGAD